MEGGKDGRRDGQTDMTKLVVGFRNFTIATKNGIGTILKVPNKDKLL